VSTEEAEDATQVLDYEWNAMTDFGSTYDQIIIVLDQQAKEQESQNCAYTCR
jgi:hypothetical protein